ncbi:cell cycle checkpoint control protein RAD9B [Erpetoichthys calabaricus]|uniref:cell cycle checkpoint control protein RAD9B n=1 Tax=Erpetoichthys calabaricus TaxID=27687 RepID=UPI002234442F|nr:cell cycle checkpoint control protein RAD9B [Erpetoichthys calabaricus]
MIFGKTLHALAKIGEEFWMDPLEKGLAVRSVSSSRSAYGCFMFSSSFFQKYIKDTWRSLDKGDCESTVKCKLSMKSVLPLFRCLSSIERNVEKCKIYILSNFVVFQFSCRHGIVKTHNLRFQECDSLQAVFARHLCPNVLKAHSSIFAAAVMHFPISQEEVTLAATPLNVKFRNYNEEENDLFKMMHTEVCLNPEEFHYFQVEVDTEITFCLKELRGLLSFAESTSLAVSVHFGEAGKPVSFSADGTVLDVNFVLATLADSESQLSPPIPSFASPARKIQKITTAKYSVVELSADQKESVSHFPKMVKERMMETAPNELVPSSQGSPLLKPNSSMENRKAPEGTSKDTHSEIIHSNPACNKICSLLFGAISSQQNAGDVEEMMNLVCSSDNED